MTETDVEEFRVLLQFVFAHNVEDLNAPGDSGPDEEHVAFGREFDPLAPAFGVERIKHTVGSNKSAELKTI